MKPMANVKINLGSDNEINKVNVYSDVDLNSKYLENTLKDRKAIENSITNLLKWKQRERIMNPGMGNSLWKRIFDNFSSFTASDIKSEVRKILSYEPRIQIESINVDTNVETTEIFIKFTYSIPAFDSSGDYEKSEYSITISK